MAGPDWQWTATLALPNGQTPPRLDSTRVTYDRTFCMPRGLSGYPTKGKTIIEFPMCGIFGCQAVRLRAAARLPRLRLTWAPMMWVAEPGADGWLTLLRLLTSFGQVAAFHSLPRSRW